MNYLLLVLIVFAVNLLPAFGPPTWAILVFARLEWNLNPVALVVLGGVAAASGRYLLAHGTRKVSGHLPQRVRDNLQGAQAALEKRRGGVTVMLGLFALSPLPSAQLFEAAGMLELPIATLTLAFFAGRLVSYAIYVSVTTVAQHQLGSVLKNAWGSPWAIAIQVVFVLLVTALPFIKWRHVAPPGATT